MPEFVFFDATRPSPTPATKEQGGSDWEGEAPKMGESRFLIAGECLFKSFLCWVMRFPLIAQDVGCWCRRFSLCICFNRFLFKLVKGVNLNLIGGGG